MTNARKLIARLNVPNVRFDVGAGGIPEMTADDVAAAVGQIKDPLGREIFCLLWWPDGARLNRNRALTELRNSCWAEQSRRAAAYRKASDDAAVLRADVDACRSEADKAALRRALGEAEGRAHAARHELWPRVAETYTHLVTAVLGEIGGTRQCPKCEGRETVATTFGRKDCDRCSGTGKVPYTDVARAAAMRVAESAYRKSWARVYDWLYEQVRELELQAGNDIRDALKP
jgi:hypothetical protein